MNKKYLVLTGAALLWAAGQPASAQLPAVDSIIVREMRARRIPGVAIAVVRDGKVIYKKAHGLANLETETPLRTDMVFELASVTKQFTAAATMMLVREGKVRLDEPIATYIDGAPAAWAGITVRQLLNHTGGLDINALPRPALMSVPTRVAFESVVAQPVRFPPATNGWYSDAGYFLLGMIIERASGQSYRQFMQTRFFDPLQMRETSITDRIRVIRGRVATYSITNNALVNWRRDWNYELPSFFGIWSTLDDLVKWDGALRSASLLDRATLTEMWTPGKLGDGEQARVLDNYYGFGFQLSDLRGQRTAGHSGASGTYLLHFVDQALSVIVLTNLDNPSGGRHPVLLARLIAGAVRPELRPQEALAVARDPDPALTQTVTTLLGDISANRALTGASDAYRRNWNASPGRRAVARNQLRTVGTVEYLGSDDVRGKVLWDAEPLVKLVYYKVAGGAQPMYITVGLTSDGKIGRLDLPYQPMP